MPKVPVELVERYAWLIRDPVHRLRFVRLCGERRPPVVWLARLATLDALKMASGEASRRLGSQDAAWLWAWRRRWIGLAVVVASLAWVPALHWSHRPPALPPVQTAAPSPPAAPPETVWLVEAGNSELYSNGLRVLNDFATHTGPRSYPVFRLGAPARPEWRHHPAGIVYHATESDLPALAPDQRQRVRRSERGLLEYVQAEHLYHFVLDRFGRVFRIVPEVEYANHAGHSLWVVEDEAYLNLNHAYFGVALEAQTGQPTEVTEAQLHSAHLLTEMLRSRYALPAAGCVSHDLVSVNPGRMLLGHHTDWAGRFPYTRLGLPDQYQLPPPAVTVFGFTYDAAFVKAVGGEVWPGLRLAEEQLAREAARRGLSTARYRRQLVQEYRQRKY